MQNWTNCPTDTTVHWYECIDSKCEDLNFTKTIKLLNIFATYIGCLIHPKVKISQKKLAFCDTAKFGKKLTYWHITRIISLATPLKNSIIKQTSFKDVINGVITQDFEHIQKTDYQESLKPISYQEIFETHFYKIQL